MTRYHSQGLIGPMLLALLLSACPSESPQDDDGNSAAPGDEGVPSHDDSDTNDETGSDQPDNGGFNGQDAGTDGSDSEGSDETGGEPGDGNGGDDGPDAGTGDGSELCPGGEPPPETWQEDWFEHEQLTKRVYYDDCIAIYFDDDMDRQYVDWISDFVGRVWKYSLKTYGYMGPGRLFATFHQSKYDGGHPAYYYSERHHYRNSIDMGGGDWRDGNYDVPAHEIAHVVESTAAYTKFGSPAFGLWGDSKWAEFYLYDVYVNLGLTEHAERVFEHFSKGSDDFPRAGTHWFRDWFYPLWRDYGHAQVMVNFFKLLEQHFPASSGGRMRDMNWGEYIHFMSGAAGTDLKDLATQAFGWPDNWEAEWQKARQDFPAITY